MFVDLLKKTVTRTNETRIKLVKKRQNELRWKRMSRIAEQYVLIVPINSMTKIEQSSTRQIGMPMENSKRVKETKKRKI